MYSNMELYIGTSGWLYDWNLEGTLDWYVRNSGLNAIELNASFYRFPFKTQVASWLKRGRELRWSIKVNRIITHVRRLNEKAHPTLTKFLALFKPMDEYVDFYLFQMPPNFAKTEDAIKRIRSLSDNFNLGPRMAIEFRHESWFNEDTVSTLRELGITLVSIDAPIGSWIVHSNEVVYLRVHGRDVWYAYDYSFEELDEISRSILKLKPKKCYIFFNNDHWMLSNARTIKGILSSKLV